MSRSYLIAACAILCFFTPAVRANLPEACCLPNGQCLDLDPMTCINAGGAPQGPFSSCFSSSCGTEACCFNDGICTNLTPSACASQGGIPQGPGTNCSNVLCPQPTEACCFSNGNCSELNSNTCLSLGGNPQGPGTNCGNVFCSPPSQACCFPDGWCLDTYPADCSAQGGIPQGPGTTCFTIICPPQVEACCLRDGTCANLYPSECDVQGGVRQGPGSNCATAACGPQAEACCLTDGTCADLSAAECYAQGGSPQGPGTTCATVVCTPSPEACCFPSGSCLDLYPSDCYAEGGAPQGPGSSCATSSCSYPACCLPDGTCIETDPDNCLSVGGSPQGPGTSCSTVLCQPQQNTEACCLLDGTCADAYPADCEAIGGNPQGPGSTCAGVVCQTPPQACCFPDGSCADLDPNSCAFNGGSPQGPGTTCATVICQQPTEACCLPDGTCFDTYAASCAAHGGHPQGPGSTCATVVCPPPTQACCFPDGNCSDLDASACAAVGGSPQGPGTSCFNVICPHSPEACCFPDGTCADLFPHDCLAQSGSPQGPGSTCATAVCGDYIGACCLPAGCVLLSAFDCDSYGGIWAGPNTNCNDSNGNGTPDGCESLPCEPCDTNCDGSINQFDLQPFVVLLTEPKPPAGCSPCAADCNRDGTVNQFDIQSFLACFGVTPPRATADIDGDSDNDGDIQRSEAEEAIEDEPPGILIAVNDDDDDGDGIPDYLEDSIDSPFEDDIVYLYVELSPNTGGGFWRLTYLDSKIRIYDVDGPTPVLIPPRATQNAPLTPNPKRLAVEAIEASDEPGDVVVFLEYQDGPNRPVVSDQLRMTCWSMRLNIHRPRVIEAAENPVPDGFGVGAQTWVNLDNDDGDDKFDIDDLDVNPAPPIGPGDNEMVKLTLRLQPPTLTFGALQLDVTAGDQYVRLWESPRGLTAYNSGDAISVLDDMTSEIWPADGELWRTKRLWVEGIEAHTAQRATKFKLTYTGRANRTDEAALTILGIKDMRWIGMGNGFTAGSNRHDSNTLDVDPNFPVGPDLPKGVRVFPDARLADPTRPVGPTNQPGPTNRTVGLEVELSVKPVEPVKVFVRSFDCDDPSDDVQYVDPNDAGVGGAYHVFGAQAPPNYTPDEDNRGSANGKKAGEFAGQQPDATAEIQFQPADIKKKINFTVAWYAGDNFRAAANGDRTFLTRLRNRDEDDGFSIVDPDVAGDVEDREVRNPPNSKYESDVLTVWLLLHVEMDSMGEVANNFTAGFITSTASGTNNSSIIRVGNNFTAGDASEVLSNPVATRDNGRFERGRLRVCDTHNLDNLTGNGATDLRYGAIVNLCATALPFRATDSTMPAPNTINGTVTALASSAGTQTNVLTVAPAGQLTAAFVGGNIRFRPPGWAEGPNMSITAVNVANNTVTVTALRLPYRVYDDDELEGTANGVAVGAPDNGEMAAAFRPVYMLPVFDGGTVQNDLNFIANIADNNSAATRNGWRFDSVGLEASTKWYTVYVRGSFQSAPDSDFDPDGEGATLGIVDNINGQGCNIYREVLRRRVAGPPQVGEYGRYSVAAGRTEAHTLAHEIGHLFGGLHSDCTEPDTYRNPAPGVRSGCIDAGGNLTGSAGLMEQSSTRTGPAFNTRCQDKFRSINHP